MRSVRLPSAVVEICPECRGLFLDDGELEKLGAGRY
jgi:Zn-finger nucleic acid-binding protein